MNWLVRLGPKIKFLTGAHSFMKQIEIVIHISLLCVFQASDEFKLNYDYVFRYMILHYSILIGNVSVLVFGIFFHKTFMLCYELLLTMCIIVGGIIIENSSVGNNVAVEVYNVTKSTAEVYNLLNGNAVYNLSNGPETYFQNNGTVFYHIINGTELYNNLINGTELINDTAYDLATEPSTSLFTEPITEVITDVVSEVFNRKTSGYTSSPDIEFKDLLSKDLITEPSTSLFTEPITEAITDFVSEVFNGKTSGYPSSPDIEFKDLLSKDINGTSGSKNPFHFLVIMIFTLTVCQVIIIFYNIAVVMKKLRDYLRNQAGEAAIAPVFEMVRIRVSPAPEGDETSETTSQEAQT